MELRGQEKDVGLPNSMGYSSPPLNHESSSKLPSAPAVPALPDRIRNELGRGTTISSPSRTLDEHNLILHEQQPQHQQEEIHKDSNPDPDPAQVANAIISSASKTSPPQPQAVVVAAAAASTSNISSSVRYRECLKNHAASMGGHVVDGCGEFMPGGEEGTPEALRCAACDCHRNFHRKESDGEKQTGTSSCYPQTHPRHTNTAHHSSVFLTQPQPSILAMPPHHQQQKYSHSYSHGLITSPTGPMAPIMMAFGRNGGAPAESSSEDLNLFQYSAGGQAVIQPASKKRFRTKFTQQQKDRMHEFADKLGWKIQKQDEEEVQQFCNELGVKRQVFKVWMHNNKQAMKKRQI